MSVSYIFLNRQLHFSPLVLGVVLGSANPGIGGAFFAGARRTAGNATHADAANTIAGAPNLLVPLFAAA